jgi:hypothetical protein
MGCSPELCFPKERSGVAVMALGTLALGIVCFVLFFALVEACDRL